MLVSTINDVISKFVGQRLDTLQILFLRFLFSLLSILPFVACRGVSSLKTTHPKFNIVRGVLGALSFYLYTYSLIKLPIIDVVTIIWTIPLFTLVLSTIFLKEPVVVTRWIATIIGFIGLAFITLYDSKSTLSFKLIYAIPVLSSLLFASQDVMIKKMVDNDSKVTMLLYFSLVTTILSLPLALTVWISPTLFEISILFALGVCGNLIQLFLFKAFRATEVSALTPYRYVEFIFASFAGFVFFGEIPGINILVGACILIPSTLYLAYKDNA